MPLAPRLPLRRPRRALVYGAAGCLTEVAFTALQDAAHPATRSWRLEGHTYLWMLPIYGLAAWLFEPLHDTMRRCTAWQRAAVYALGITAVEEVAGLGIRRLTGLVPWDYRGHSRFALPGGAVRLDYLPVWAVAGLALERVHDALRALPPGTAPS